MGAGHQRVGAGGINPFDAIALDQAQDADGLLEIRPTGTAVSGRTAWAPRRMRSGVPFDFRHQVSRIERLLKNIVSPARTAVSAKPVINRSAAE